MATMSKPTPVRGISHEYDADARLLGGQLQRPAVRKIDGGVFSSLKGVRDRHIYQPRQGPYNLDGLISFEAGYTRVSGSHEKGKSWVSLATAVLEDLNIFDVITADRVVAQASTEHPPFDGHVPSVTFLGSRFENLRINGYPVNPDLELGICGDKPAGDGLYSEDPDFLDRMKRQTEAIASTMDLPASLRVEYDNELKQLGEVRKYSGTYGKGYESTLKCSIVKGVAAIPVAKSFGHILEIPGLGIVTLGKLEVEQTWSKAAKVTTYFDLTMIDIQMGSIGEGNAQVANVGVNGNHVP
jgi:hypothetical protein